MEEWTFENADMSDAVMHRAKITLITGINEIIWVVLFWDRLVPEKLYCQMHCQ